MHSAHTSTTSSSMSFPECEKCLEMHGQLKEVQDELQRLKEKSENLRKENETLQRNSSSLLATDLCEIQRIDHQICELLKK